MNADIADNGERTLGLANRAAAGDPVALKLLLTEAYPQICARISARIPQNLRRMIDGEDVVQEAEIQVFLSIGSFDPREPNSFYRWFATIALSRLRDAIRRERAAKRGGAACASGHARGAVDDSTIALLDMLAGPGHTPSQSMARRESIEAVATALGQIPEHYRQAIRLVYIEGRPAAEVAAQLGRTERAVYGLCRRGLVQLRKQLRSASRFFSASD